MFTTVISVSPYSGYLNDLWKYEGGQWTWMSGSNQTYQNGTYGQLGIANSSNIPGSRQSAVSWIDSNNTLWLFGGEGNDATTVGGQ